MLAFLTWLFTSSITIRAYHCRLHDTKNGALILHHLALTSTCLTFFHLTDWFSAISITNITCTLFTKRNFFFHTKSRLFKIQLHIHLNIPPLSRRSSPTASGGGP